MARAREDAARFLGVDPARTALVPNASAGVSVVFASLATEPGWQGAELVVTDHGYGAVVLGAERAAAGRAAPIRRTGLSGRA